MNTTTKKWVNPLILSIIIIVLAAISIGILLFPEKPADPEKGSGTIAGHPTHGTQLGEVGSQFSESVFHLNADKEKQYTNSIWWFGTLLQTRRRSISGGTIRWIRLLHRI